MFVAHLDADCFYVSAERVRNAGLVGLPVVVLGNNGTCCIAKSYEAKAAGIKTGEPVWDATAKCPEVVLVKRDFKWYEVLSRLMLDVVRRHSASVEYYSIDEFFFRLDAPARDAEKVARRIRDEVMRAVKVPATVGVGRTRTLAKLISDRAKPFGALALTDRAAEEEYLARLPVTEVSGIGAGRARRLASYGLSTCLDLCNASPALVRKLLTVVGDRLRDELRGVPRETIHADRPAHQTLSRGGSVGTPTADRGIVWAWAIRNLERLIEELEFHRVRPGRLTLWMSYADDATRVAELDMASPTDRFDLLVDALRCLMRECWRDGSERCVRMSLIASKLRDSDAPTQGTFWDAPPGPWVQIAALKREANARVRRWAVRSGATLPLHELYQDGGHAYEICDVRGKVCF